MRKVKKIFSAVNCTPRNAYQYFDFVLSAVSVKPFYKPYSCFNLPNQFFNNWMSIQTICGENHMITCNFSIWRIPSPGILKDESPKVTPDELNQIFSCLFWGWEGYFIMIHSSFWLSQTLRFNILETVYSVGEQRIWRPIIPGFKL